jgi:hypothetical protein
MLSKAGIKKNELHEMGELKIFMCLASQLRLPSSGFLLSVADSEIGYLDYIIPLHPPSVLHNSETRARFPQRIY